MEKNILQKNISSETISAIFIVIFVSLFILANLAFGFIWPLFILAMAIGFILSVRFPQSGLLASLFLIMIFERFFTLQTFFIGKVEYKIYPLDLIMAGIIIGMIIQYLCNKNKIRLNRAGWALAGFILLNVIYFFASAYIFKSDSYLSFSSLKNYAFYSLFYFITIFLIRTKEDLLRLFKFFLAGAVAIIIFIIIGIFRGEGLWSQFTPLSTSGVRVLAFTHGLYITLALFPVLFYLIFKPSNNKWLYFLAAIWIIGIFGTLMRHLWISVALVLAISYILLPKISKAYFKEVIFKFTAPALVILVFFTYFSLMFPQSQANEVMQKISGTVIERAGSLGNVGNDESFYWRNIVWKGAYEMYKRSPILGIGTGQRIYVESQDYKDFVEVRNVHNSYLSILIQLGILGIVIFAYFLYKSLRSLFSNFQGEEYRLFRFSVFGILAVYLIAFVFQPYLETNLLAIPFWIALGLTGIPANLKKEEIKQ